MELALFFAFHFHFRTMWHRCPDLGDTWFWIGSKNTWTWGMWIFVSRKFWALYVDFAWIFGFLPTLWCTVFKIHGNRVTWGLTVFEFLYNFKAYFLMAILIIWNSPISWLTWIFKPVNKPLYAKISLIYSKIALLMRSFEQNCVSGICEFECKFKKTLAAICCMYVLKN